MPCVITTETVAGTSKGKTIRKKAREEIGSVQIGRFFDFGRDAAHEARVQERRERDAAGDEHDHRREAVAWDSDCAEHLRNRDDDHLPWNDQSGNEQDVERFAQFAVDPAQWVSCHRRQQDDDHDTAYRRNQAVHEGRHKIHLFKCHAIAFEGNVRKQHQG